jgi:hypothetical protein
MYALLPFLHKIFISSAKSNVKSLVSLLEYFRYSQPEKNAYLASFKANEIPFSHFCLDINNRSLRFLTPDDSDMSGLADISSADSYAMAETLLSELENAGKAKAVFNLISKKLKKINSDDLTVILVSGKTGRPVIISLVDYLSHLTSPPTSSQPPEKILLHFHVYICKRVHIPKCFILNKHFR